MIVMMMAAAVRMRMLHRFVPVRMRMAGALGNRRLVRMIVVCVARAVHVEHTFALLDDGVWVLTAHDGGRSRLPGLISGRAEALR